MGGADLALPREETGTDEPLGSKIAETRLLNARTNGRHEFTLVHVPTRGVLAGAPADADAVAPITPETTSAAKPSIASVVCLDRLMLAFANVCGRAMLSRVLLAHEWPQEA